MEGTELDLLREAYRQLKKVGFHQRSPEEKARLEALFKRLAAFLREGAGEPESRRVGEKKEPGSRGAGEPGKREEVPAQVKDLILNVDGASKGNPGPAGAGGVLATPEGEEVESFAVSLGQKTNNEAEYLALIEGLKRAKRLSPSTLLVRSDSLLLVKQMRGEFKVKKYELVKLHLEARRYFPCKGIRFEHVPREMNAEADRLANLGVAEGSIRE
jgi:ribonuclease HI